MRKVWIEREIREKIDLWTIEDQIFFSALQAVVLEDAFDAILGREDVTLMGCLTNDDAITEIVFLIELPSHQNRFVLRQRQNGDFEFAVR